MAGGTFGNRQRVDDARKRGSDFAGSDLWKYKLRLEDGETVIGRLVGGEDEPHDYEQHGNATQEPVICNRGGGGHCPACVASAAMRMRDRKSTIIKGASARAAFTFLSTRVFFTRQNGDKKEKINRVVNADGWPMQVRKVGSGEDAVTTVQCYPTESHEFDGVLPWEYEGLVVLDLSNTEKMPQTKTMLDLDATLAERCQCCTPVGTGPGRRPARIVRAGLACASCNVKVNGGDPTAVLVCPSCRHAGEPVELIGCEANCGNPARGGLGQCYIKVTRTGTRLNTTLSFEALPASELTEEHALLLVNSDGTRKSLDLKTIYAPKEGAIAGMVRQLAPQLRSLGVDPEACINPGGGGQQQARSPQGHGGMPNFGGPTQAAPPRVALPPSPAFPTGGVGNTVARPPSNTATVQPTGTQPLSGGVTSASPPPARPGRPMQIED